MAFLETHRSTVDDIFGRLGETIERLVRDPMPEVTRAVGRLVKDAYKLAWKHSDDAERTRKILEALDRAAKELETV